ncbi:MAG TPA: hypothetical protein VNA16_10885 [Abditibacteriaceae bacterium]|nr:hypothetical protein [Abditibacteriaceae bacterium]
MSDSTSQFQPSPALQMEPDLSAYDGRSIMLNILSFILPPLGLVLYLLLMIARLPQKAASAGRSATIGVIAYGIALLLAGLIGLVIVVRDEMYPPRYTDTEEATAPIRPPVNTDRMR